MPFPAIILGAIASAIIGKVVGKVLENGDQKSGSTDPFQLLFNKLTSNTTTDTAAAASPSGSTVASSAKKETTKDDKLKSVDRTADVSSLVAALESQRIQLQPVLPTFQTTNNQQVCEVPRMSIYAGTDASPVGSVGAREAIKVHVMNGLSVDALNVQDVMKTEQVLPQVLPAIKKPVQLKAAYSAVSAHASNGHPLKVLV